MARPPVTLYVFIAIVIGLPILVFALVGVRYLTRDTPLNRVRSHTRAGHAPAISDPLFVPTLQLTCHVQLLPGHELEVMTCGDETYPRLWEDLRGARRSITVQMYYGQPGVVADTLQQILCERARAGVKVLFLRDAFGAGELTQEYLDTMRHAGVEVATFRPVQWYALDKSYARSHIRIVVIDGAIGYTGGFGIADKWLGDGRSHEHWRDTNVRFTGPAVAQHQATFAAGWTEATGELLTGEIFFPEHVIDDHAAGSGAVQPDGALAGVLHTAPTIGSTAAERFLALTIASARERLWISNGYFVPDQDFIGLLTYAARRGTDVRVLTAGESDVKTVKYAGRATYEALLEGGVRIWEYQPTMIHCKTVVADGRWACIGTMNFDNRSLAFNDETMCLIYDAGAADRLERAFERDLELAHEITLEEWRRRGALERLRERAFSLIGRVI